MSLLPRLPPLRAHRSLRRSLLGRNGRRVAGGTALAGGLLLAALLLVSIGQLGRIVPGTRVLGVDLGGQDVWAARRLLAAEVGRLERRPLAVSAPGVRLTLDADAVDVTVDVPATLEDALARGRGGRLGPLGRLVAPLVDGDVRPRTTFDEAALVAWVERTAADVERAAHPGDLSVDAAARSVEVIGPQGAIVVDRAASVARLREALLDPSATVTALVTRTTPPPTDRAPIEALAARVEAALRVPRVLEHEGRRLAVDGQSLAAMMTIVPRLDGDRVVPTLHIPVERLEASIGADARRTFTRTPVPARIEVPDVDVELDALGSTGFRPVAVTTTVVGSVDRSVLVPRRTARQLERMVVEGIERETADLLIIEPDPTTAEAEARRPTHVIGTFTTRYVAGGARTVNIARLAALLDDTFIAPGAEFSVNRTSGPRSCAAGFLEAGTIVRGELVDTCGGGVSQLGTTLLNAAFFAGLPLTEWQPHSFFIGRYPAGREATLSYPDLDVRFRNDTDGWIALRASTTPTSVTVTLLGRPRWAEVRAEHGPWGPPTPFSEVVRTAPDLAPGARRVVQAGGEGFALTVARTRITRAGDVAPEVERWRTVYRPQQRIVEVSPGDAPGDAAPPAADAGASAG